MHNIEDYIAKRKKEDALDEFSKQLKDENIKKCIDYVFEYFNIYLNMTKSEERTILKEDQIEAFRKTISEYDPDIQEWLVNIFEESGHRAHRTLKNLISKYELFLLCYSDADFREASYEIYPKAAKRIPILKGQSEMIYLFIKDYHRLHSHEDDFDEYVFSEEIKDWLYKTYAKYHVNLPYFATTWVMNFHANYRSWPLSYRLKSANPLPNDKHWPPYDYNYKQKRNLFNLDTLYPRISNRPFIKGRKQELEIMMMKEWMEVYAKDDFFYWGDYLNRVLLKI